MSFLENYLEAFSHLSQILLVYSIAEQGGAADAAVEAAPAEDAAEEAPAAE